MKYITGTVYSSREKVNVIIPGTQFWGEGNHFFAAANKRVHDYIRECINEVIREEVEIGKEYRRKVAQCYSTTAREIAAGNKGYGLGEWANNGEVALFEIARGEYRLRITEKVSKETISDHE